MPVLSEIVLFDADENKTYQEKFDPLMYANLPAALKEKMATAAYVTLINKFMGVSVEELGTSVDEAIKLAQGFGKKLDIISVLPDGQKFPAVNVNKMREFGTRLFAEPKVGSVFVVVPEGAQMLAFFAFTVGKLIGYDMHRASNIEQAEQKISDFRKG